MALLCSISLMSQLSVFRGPLNMFLGKVPLVVTVIISEHQDSAVLTHGSKQECPESVAPDSRGARTIIS